MGGRSVPILRTSPDFQSEFFSKWAAALIIPRVNRRLVISKGCCHFSKASRPAQLRRTEHLQYLERL
jgi:hypothetical protein